MRRQQDLLVNAYYNYSRDINENMDRFEIMDRVEHLANTNKEMFAQEIRNMKELGYIKGGE